MTPERDPYAGTTISNGKVVPLISSYVAGPLGLMHLPRLWLKALLHANDLLAEDWGCGPGGLDKRIMEFVGIDATAFVPWLARTLPTYDEAEQWVRANALTLTPAAIAESNALLSTHGLPRGLVPEFQAYLRLDPSVTVGIMLNNYDDWETVDRHVRSREGGEPIVPAVSPAIVGVLGVPQLPRLWLKRTLALAHALPANYALRDEPADEAILAALRLSPAETFAHLAATRPNYVDFERYVRDAARRNAAEVPWSEVVGLDEPSIAAVHTYDWDLLRAQVLAHEDGGATAPSVAGVHAFSVSGRLQRP